jgi:hypothetical protein
VINEAVYQHLAATASVAALVGTRIHPLVIPQRIAATSQRVPAVVYSISGVDRAVSYCGTDRLVRSTLGIDCYAAGYDAARELATAVRTALVDFSGPMGSSTVVPVRTCNIETEFDLMDIEPGLYRVSQQWTIWHEE